MKIAYFGFDLFYDCLEKLKKCNNEILKIFTCEVDGVYETSDKVYDFAKKNGIDITEKKPSFNDILALKERGCEMLFSAGYYHKIPGTDLIPGLNVHPALLPNGRGPWPQPVTILRSLKITGITIHKLADKFDSGEIVLQIPFKIDESDNLETLGEKYINAAVNAIEIFFSDPARLLSNATVQPEGEYWPEPSVTDMTFDIKEKYQKIDCITRAFYGFFCFMIHKGETIKISKAYCTHFKPECREADDVIKIDDGWLVVVKYA